MIECVFNFIYVDAYIIATRVQFVAPVIHRTRLKFRHLSSVWFMFSGQTAY